MMSPTTYWGHRCVYVTETVQLLLNRFSRDSAFITHLNINSENLVFPDSQWRRDTNQLIQRPRARTQRHRNKLQHNEDWDGPCLKSSTCHIDPITAHKHNVHNAGAVNRMHDISWITSTCCRLRWVSAGFHSQTHTEVRVKVGETHKQRDEELSKMDEHHRILSSLSAQCSCFEAC